MKLRERIGRLLFPSMWQLIDALREHNARLDELSERLNERLEEKERMTYLVSPIDLTQFDREFRKVRSLDNATLVAFRQGKKRWSASYQDGEVRLDYSGDTAKLRHWLSEREIAE